MQLRNGLLRQHYYLQQIRKGTSRTFGRNIHQIQSSRTKTQVRKMLFFQMTHTISWTPNFCRRHPAPTRETQKHSQNASTKKPKGSETISRISRLLQKICSQICRHLKSTNTFNQKGCRIQMDTRMQELFLDIERILTASTNTQIPRPSSQLHTLQRCILICICRHIDTTQQRHRPPYHIRKQIIPWITIKLGNTYKRSLHNLHVSKKNSVSTLTQPR